MQKKAKVLAKRVLPPPVLRILRELRRHKDPVLEADIDAAWNYKRVFFWKAFKALEFNGIDGDYVEFGSFSGMTFRLAFDQIRYRKIKRHMWAFDSFEGLPEASSPFDSHPVWKKGSMATSVEEFHRICKSHGIPKDVYTVVQGFYKETLTEIREDDPPTNIALAYIDCDMYSSAKTVLEFLVPRLKQGMILAFDDYFCWSAEHISGEREAFLQVCAANQELNMVPFRDYGWGSRSFVVERAV